MAGMDGWGISSPLLALSPIPVPALPLTSPLSGQGHSLVLSALFCSLLVSKNTHDEVEGTCL